MKQRKTQQKKQRRKQSFLCLILTAAVLTGITGPQTPARAAAEVTLKIMEGETGHAINRNLHTGEVRTGWTIQLSHDRTVKKAEWKTSDPAVMTVDGDSSGATVTAHKEGTAVLTLTVRTDKDETVTDDCLISSMTRLETSRQAAGSLTATADLYRGARTTSIVRNTAPAGQTLTVIGLCGGFYRVRLPESFDFNDTLTGQMTAYVLKNKVRIPVTSVSIPNADRIRSLKVGQKAKASFSFLPDLATGKEMAWKSSDTGVAAVENDGSITAKKAGTAVITLTEKNSGRQASVTITVSDVLATSLNITNTKELKNLSVGSTATAKTSMAPADISKKKLMWKSSNTKVASVDQNGTIRVLAGGSAVITVTEQYSGLTASAAIGAGYSLGAPKGKSQPKIRLKKSTDFRGNTITWNRISGAKYYRVHVEHWDKTKKKYIRIYKNGKKVKKTAYYDRNVAKNQKCRYCVVAYGAKNKALTAGKKKAKKVTIKATAPDLSVTVGQLGKLKLDWKKGSTKNRKGIQGYKIYRGTAEKRNQLPRKYTLVKTIRKKNTLTWTDTKLREGTSYYYRIRAYGKQKKKTVTGAYSDIKSARTISGTANWNYYNKMKPVWQGVCMEKKQVTEKQSTERMKHYTVKKDGTDVSPYIKYHLTTDTLYIHVYVRFYTYDRKTGNETAAPVAKGTYANDPGKKGGSYREEFVKGVTSTFSTFIQGNKDKNGSYDFDEGVAFHTKLVLHEKDKGSYPVRQEFLGVTIGGDCDCNDCLRHIPSQLKESSNYWFHASPCSAGCVFSPINAVHIPDNRYLIRNKKKQPVETVSGFRSVCAHEIGHILGLGDGYKDADTLGNIVDRMTYSDETCFRDNNEWRNLMTQSRDYSMIRPNDLEMMMLAYGLSFDPKQTWLSLLQYYKTHTWDGYERIISTVIRKGKTKNEKQ